MGNLGFWANFMKNSIFLHMSNWDLGAVRPWACVVARPKKELCKDCAGSAMGQVLLGWRQPLLLLVVLYYNVVKGQSAREIDTLVWPLNTHRQAVYYAGYYAGTQHSRPYAGAANGTALVLPGALFRVQHVGRLHACARTHKAATHRHRAPA